MIASVLLGAGGWSDPATIMCMIFSKGQPKGTAGEKSPGALFVSSRERASGAGLTVLDPSGLAFRQLRSATSAP